MTDSARKSRQASQARGAPAKARGRPSKRHLKREALLEGATALFNARGIAGTSLSDVAEKLGLARASVYYYVNDRAELVFQCYLRACERTAEDLAAASRAAAGFERISAFIGEALAPDRAQSAVLSDIGYLDSPSAQVVKVANDRNIATLIGFLEQGVEDGSVRPCDCEVAAQSIFGMIAWAQLTPQWVTGRHSRAFRTRLLGAVVSVVSHGLGRERAPFHCLIDADSFLPGRFNAFDRRESAELKVEQLLGAASRLFNRNGIEATSLDHITAALGATTGVFYHYLRDKSDLVTRCYERAFDLFERIAQTAKSQGTTGLERALLVAHINAQGQAGALSPLMPQPGLEALPDAYRGSLAARANSLNKLVSGFLRQGVADGSCNPCDAALAAHMSAGAFGWLPKWLPEDDPRSPRRLADEICALFSLGLRAPSNPTQSRT